MEWIRIFSTPAEAREKIPENKTQLVVIGGKRICLARYRDEFYAVQDRCTHNSESLSGGAVNHLGEVICPWHNYRFELKSGKACDSACADLETFPLKVDMSGFFIAI